MQIKDSNKGAASVLVVDDNPRNLKVLCELLTAEGYRARPAISGDVAIKIVRVTLIDLILLDIRMPDMDGYEVCRRLKSEPKTAEIPIIFISAMDSVEDKVQAFDHGGVDYITKLFQVKEVLARVNTHVSISYLQRQLRARSGELLEANQNLEESIDTLKKTQDKMIESEKMASLGQLVVGVAHEVNTPLGIAITGSSYSGELISGLRDKVGSTNEIDQDVLHEFMDTSDETIDLVMSSLKRAAKIIDSFRQIAVDQSVFVKKEFNLKKYINISLESLYPIINKRDIKVSVNCDDDFVVNSYPGAFAQIISGLVMNSLEHSFEENEGGKLSITAEMHGDQLELAYSDNGVGISSEYHKRIFDPFFSLKSSRGVGKGMGLYILFNLVNHQLGGTIRCDSNLDGGVLFVLDLPLISPELGGH